MDVLANPAGIRSLGAEAVEAGASGCAHAVENRGTTGRPFAGLRGRLIQRGAGRDILPRIAEIKVKMEVAAELYAQMGVFTGGS